MLRKLVKALHEVGAIGVLGSLAACIVLVATAPPPESLAGYAAVRVGIAALARWLLVPSLALVTASGLLAIVVNRAYVDAGWAWLKAVLGISAFLGTLLTVAGSARHAAVLATLAAAGSADRAGLALALRAEWGALWTLLALALVNVGLGVWRPRFTRAASPPL